MHHNPAMRTNPDMAMSLLSENFARTDGTGRDRTGQTGRDGTKDGTERTGQDGDGHRHQERQRTPEGKTNNRLVVLA